jgi:protein-tyrosine phosphatase
MRTITALSKESFDVKMIMMNLNDSNVESKGDHFFISITPSMFYGKEIDENEIQDYGNVYPYFRQDHKNVMRMFYDDVMQDMLQYKALDAEQARRVVEFIKQIKECEDATVIVHCTAGKSRSVATAYFIAEYLGMNISDVEARSDATPNLQVLHVLRECAK